MLPASFYVRRYLQLVQAPSLPELLTRPHSLHFFFFHVALRINRDSSPNQISKFCFRNAEALFLVLGGIYHYLGFFYVLQFHFQLICFPNFLVSLTVCNVSSPMYTIPSYSVTPILAEFPRSFTTLLC